MNAPILVTKLFIPPTRTEIVQRPGLIERLNNGLDRKLTLLSAPAGFGKTTLVSNWVENLRDNTEISDYPIRFAWLSLDEDDNDPVRFLTYFITALNQIKEIDSDLGQGALSMIQSPQPPPTNAVLISLINELAAIPDKIVIVLDDCHLIEAEPIHQALFYLLENLPPQLHVVISTRQDPPLSLGRLRARVQITELRAVDLRFSAKEAADFLNRVMGLNLSAEDIAELETRTEGWIAGLQLAAISMRGYEDHAGFIKSFTGGHRLVLDFLIEEVLGQQPENIQNFLLQTAVLDRMTGSLCDALTGQKDSQATLEMLDRANLFIVPLDSECRWYRYHHLFTDLLRQRLRQTQPDQLPILQRQASKWYRENGFIDEAIEFALRARDFRQASHLIEDVAETLWVPVEHTRLQRWLAGLPVDLIFSKPSLCVFHAWLLLSAGQQDVAERTLLVAEHVLGIRTDHTADTSSMAWELQDRSDRMKLIGRVAATRAFLAFFRGDVQSSIQYARQALETLPEQDLTWRSTAAFALGDAHSINGDETAAYQARLKALEASKAVGNTYMTLVANVRYAITLRQLGWLQQVSEICQQQMQLANESGMLKIAVVGWLLAVWGEVLAEFNELDNAIKNAEKGVELTEQEGDQGMFGWSNVCWVRVLYSCGDMIGAEKVIHEINSIARKQDLPPWVMNLLIAWQARLWLAQGKLEAASQWVEDRGLDVGGAIEILREPEYIVLARVLTAQGRLDEATTLLQQLLKGTETGGRISRAIEILILQALALQAQGETAQAIITLERAISLTEPSGFIRIFVDEGPPMASLLYEAFSRGIAPKYVQRLLAAFPDTEPKETASTKPQVEQSQLIEPLSAREIEVLQLLAKGLTNQVIATRLVLSPHTIKAHTRNIYSKLGVNNRTQALDRARKLGILSQN